MKVLGIETSCDETAAAVVENGQRLISSVVNSQIDIHAEYGGVVPEVAARSHLGVINPVINQALRQANCTWDDIDTIAVTYAPGLIGSLLIGTLVARTLAIIHHKPLYKIHHIEAHVYANFITSQGDSLDKTAESPNIQKHLRPELPKSPPDFPFLALIVSGGHSQLMLFHDHGDFELLGQTQDDAVGEAFDKVAKILGLPYPGGPSIAKAAELGDPKAFDLPIAKLSGRYDFSFSGLKTAVLRAVQREVGKDFNFPSHKLPGLVNDELRHNMAASFQQTAVKTLVDKTKLAFEEFQPKSVVIAGGVAANQELRRQLSLALPLEIEYAPISLCTDNAVMVASLAYFQAQNLPPDNPFDMEVQPSLSMLSELQQGKEVA